MLKLLARMLNRKRVFIGLLILCILITIPIVLFWKIILSNIEIISTIVSFIIAAILYVIRHPKVYMLITYLKAVIFGEKTLWNLSVKYQGHLSANQFKKIHREFEAMSQEKIIQEESNNYYKAILDGMNIEFKFKSFPDDDFDSEYNTKQELYFHILQDKEYFENVLDYLENEVMPYIEKIEKQIKTNNSDFNLQIKFLDKNPWVEAISKGIKFEDILALDFVMNLKTSNEKTSGKLQVTKQDLIVSCNEAGALSRLIKDRLLPY